MPAIRAPATLSLEPVGPGATTRKPKVQSGTTGVATRNPEGLINLLVARRLQQELVDRGAEVVMVRTSQDVNIANSKRATIANDAEADLFIRLHCDGNDKRSKTGLSTLVPAFEQVDSADRRQSKYPGGTLRARGGHLGRPGPTISVWATGET